MTPEEAAWAAGIVEGEGYIGATNRWARCTVGMTDFDVIERLHALVPGGRLYRKHLIESGGGGARKPQLVWTLIQAEALEHFLLSIRPYMGVRRTHQIDETLARVRDQSRRVGGGQTTIFDVCPSGHLKAVNIDNNGRCSICRRAATKEWHRKHPEQKSASDRRYRERQRRAVREVA